MTRVLIITLAAILVTLSGCGITIFHVGHLDHVPHVGWRPHASGNVCNFECFDDEGEVLGACAGCYDADKHPIAGCRPGLWQVSPDKAEIDAKIIAKRTEDHCRLTVYGCACMALAWTDAQKKVYPACDPMKGAR